jgi:hypothetical protein
MYGMLIFSVIFSHMVIFSHASAIDGQVYLIPVQKDNFCLFLRQQTDERTRNVRLHNGQMVNGLG